MNILQKKKESNIPHTNDEHAPKAEASKSDCNHIQLL